MKPRHFLIALALSVCLPLQAATEVISLGFRPASELLSAAQSVVAQRGRVSAQGNQLIVSAPAEVIAELRQVIEQLDIEAKRLLITVDTRTAASAQDRGYAISGEAGDRESAQVRIIRHSTQGKGSGMQQIQVSEGYPAFIQVGESVPLTSSGSDIYGQPYQQSEYRDVMRGFYATATVHGDRVQVSISTVNDQLHGQQPEVVDLQRTDTRIRGRLGDWITISTHSDGIALESSEPVRRYSTAGTRDSTVRLKIDRLD